MISADDFTTIRTSKQLEVPVWFYFDGQLFLDDGIEIKFKSNFKGFNCATRHENNYITSYEYVEFDNDLIDQIYNPSVNFVLPAVENHNCNIHGRTVFSINIPINRIAENYRALEAFTFSFDNNNLNDVTLAWTRYSEPRVEEEAELGYRWLYCGNGVKMLVEPSGFESFTKQRKDTND